MQLVEHAASDDHSETTLALAEGRVLNQVEHWEPASSGASSPAQENPLTQHPQKYEVQTPTGVVAVRGTIFEVTVQRKK